MEKTSVPGNKIDNAKKRYAKSAFVDAASNFKERSLYQIALEDDKRYTEAEAAKTVSAWENKTVKEAK